MGEQVDKISWLPKLKFGKNFEIKNGVGGVYGVGVEVSGKGFLWVWWKIQEWINLEVHLQKRSALKCGRVHLYNGMT